MVHGHRLFWELHGLEAQPTVVFLHHGLGSGRSWRRQIPDFLAAGWRVLVFDRWGYGRSDPRPAFTPGYLRQDAEETMLLLDALAIPRASILGHSDGGSIGLLVAAAFPQRIERLVVVAGHIYYEPSMGNGLRGIRAAALRPPLKNALAREHGSRSGALVQAWIDHWLGSDPPALNLLDILPKVACPTLVVQGELDEHATPQHARDVAQGVPDGHLWLIPGVHHNPPFEIPKTFNRRVIHFLGGKAPPPSRSSTRFEGL